LCGVIIDISQGLSVRVDDGGENVGTSKLLSRGVWSLKHGKDEHGVAKGTNDEQENE
jgi:hypothetical protein